MPLDVWSRASGTCVWRRPAADLPASILADLTGTSVDNAARWTTFVNGRRPRGPGRQVL